MCLLFVTGLVFITTDSWESNRAAAERVSTAAENAEGRRLGGKESSAVRAGVAAFWVSSWLSTGFLVSAAFACFAYYDS